MILISYMYRYRAGPALSLRVHWSKYTLTLVNTVHMPTHVGRVVVYGSSRSATNTLNPRLKRQRAPRARLDVERSREGSYCAHIGYVRLTLTLAVAQTPRLRMSALIHVPHLLLTTI